MARPVVFFCSLRRRAAITALVAIALGGCGGGGHAAQPDTGSYGFMGRLSNGLVFVEWTVSGGQLAGTLFQDVVQRQRRGPETVHVVDAVLTGTIIGDRLILSINGAGNIAGTFRGAQLVLDYPDPQNSTLVGGLLVGSVLVLGMQPATARGYDQALSTLQRQVAAVNATAHRSHKRARKAVFDGRDVPADDFGAWMASSSALTCRSVAAGRAARAAPRSCGLGVESVMVAKSVWFVSAVGR